MLFTRERLYYNVERLMTYKKKILSPHEESNLRPSDLRSDALPLSHKDSSVSGVYYEVLLFCQKHYAIDIADPSSMQDACH